MKKYITTLIIFVLVLGLIAITYLLFSEQSGNTNAGVNLQTHTNPEHGFAFQYPRGSLVSETPIFSYEPRGGVEIQINSIDRACRFCGKPKI